MARHGGLGTAAILYSFGQLGSSLSQYAGRQREQKRKKRMAILGAEFSKRIAEVTDVDELTGLMLKANEIASVMEIPELAQQINNLGRLKQLQLVNSKKELEAGQLSQFTGNLLSDQIVQQGDEFLKFSETDIFKKIKEYPVGIQSETLVKAFNQMKATIQKVVTEGATGYNLRIYASGEGGRSKLISDVRQSDDGTYDDFLTKDKVEQFSKPIEIAQQEFADLGSQKASNLIASRNKGIYGKPFKTIVFQDANNRPVFISYSTNQKDGSLLITDMDGNKITQEQLNELSKNKQKLPENPYESPIAYDKWFKKLDETNTNNASNLVHTILQSARDEGKNPKTEHPNLYYEAEFNELKLGDSTVSLRSFLRSGDLDRWINKQAEKGSEAYIESLRNLKQAWYNSNKDFEAIQNRTYQPNKKKKSTTVIKPEDKPGNTGLVSPFVKDSSGGFSIYSN